MIELDHLVVAAGSLHEGARWLQAMVGVAPDPGGSHAGFGTHNALLRLGSDVYLELLALDPEQPSPPRPPLFGLGERATRELLARGPRLLHWVVRTRHLPAAVKRLAKAAGVLPAAMGTATTMRRGDLSWSLAVEAGGSRPPGGLPSVIDWGGAIHPCSRLADHGVRLERLEIVAPTSTLSALSELGRDARIALTPGAEAGLTARIATPSGPATLK